MVFSEFFLAFERNLFGYAWKCGCLKTNTNMLPIVNPTQGFSQCPFFLVRTVLGHLWYALKLKRVSLEEQMQHLHFPMWAELFSSMFPAAVFSPSHLCIPLPQPQSLLCAFERAGSDMHCCIYNTGIAAVFSTSALIILSSKGEASGPKCVLFCPFCYSATRMVD